LITGCNTGIGFEAARILARQGNTIVMACRTLQKAAEAAKKIQQETPAANLIPAECDLASLESIKSFVQTLKVDTIDVACYNAGISLNQFDTEAQRTKEGFELTVGTNHLGHFYLNSLLLPTKINKSTGKIVVTASAVHDPESPGGAQGKTATLGDLEGFIRDGKNFEMVDGQPFNGDKAYKDSKLCNVFFCRELQRRLSSTQSTKDITVNSFSPGLITTTGLFRYQSPIFIPIFSFIATKVAKVAETPEWGGAALAYMTQVDTRGQYYNSPPGSSKYGDAAFGKQFTIYDVSKEAHDDAKSRKLWELSEKLVGV
jgi:protochlorophyllide reductase